MKDEGVNVRAEDIMECPDHYIYAMAEHTTFENIAKKFYNATPEDIKKIVTRHAEKMQIFNLVKDKLKDKDEGAWM